MAADKKLPVTFVIGAVDEVTYKVMAINEKIKAITAPVNDVKKAFATLGNEVGASNLAQAMGSVASTGKTLFTELASAVTKVGFVIGGTAASVYALVHSFADAGDNINQKSAQLGLSAKAYQELAYAAEQANVPLELFDSGMTKFSKNIGEAKAKMGEALPVFQLLKIDWLDSNKAIKTNDQLFTEVIKKLGGITDQNVRNLFSTRLLGKEGAKFNDIMKDGTLKLQQRREEAGKNLAIMSEDDLKKAEEFDNAFKSITRTLSGVKNIIAAALAPAIQAAGKALQVFLVANQKDIHAFADALGKRLPAILEGLGTILMFVVKAFTALLNVLMFLSDTFGGLNVVVGGLLAFFGGGALLSAVASFSGAILNLVWIIGSLIFAVVGLPGVILAAFVGLGYLIYKNLDPILKFLDSVWDKMTRLMSLNFSSTAVGPGGGSLAQQPSLGPPAGFAQTVDAAQRSTTTQQESLLRVDFSNMPVGTRVETKEAGMPFDLTQGYSILGN